MMNHQNPHAADGGQLHEAAVNNEYDAEVGLTACNAMVASVLNDLLETCRDGAFGFRACAEEVPAGAVRQLFVQRADECCQAEAQLLPLIVAFGGEPTDGGSVRGSVHRGWVHAKGLVGLDSELSILASCEQGEDVAVARYGEALNQQLPEDIRAVVEQQAAGAQRNCEQIRHLRDAVQAREDRTNRPPA